MRYVGRFGYAGSFFDGFMRFFFVLEAMISNIA